MSRVRPRATVGVDTLAYDVDIGSREDISLDYVARIRVHYLMAQHTSLLRQVQSANTRAGALIALMALIATRLTLDAQAGAVVGPAGALIALKAVVLVGCLMVVLPYYPGRRAQRRVATMERFSWIALSSPSMTADDYADFARTAEVSQMAVSTAHANAALARSLAGKLRWLRASMIAAMGDVALTAVIYAGARSPYYSTLWG